MGLVAIVLPIHNPNCTLKSFSNVVTASLLVNSLMAISSLYGSVSKPCTPVVHIKIAGKWMFIPLKMVLIGIDPYPNICRYGTKRLRPSCPTVDPLPLTRYQNASFLDSVTILPRGLGRKMTFLSAQRGKFSGYWSSMGCSMRWSKNDKTLPAKQSITILPSGNLT